MNLITILGPTAVGKTSLAARLAQKFEGEIISADSRQVYRGMDIGTGKDLGDYIVDGQKIPYHLIDIAGPNEEFNLYRFQEFFYKAFYEITSRGKMPFLTGGTGLFLDAVLRSYNMKEAIKSEEYLLELDLLSLEELKTRLIKANPKLHNTTDLLEKKRIIDAIRIAESSGIKSPFPEVKIDPLVIGVRLERREIKERITRRLKQRLQEGMIDEVKLLLEQGVSYERLDLFGLEYRFIGQYLKGSLSYNDMYQKLNSAIHAFAKRQMTWFRKMEREGVNINWIEGPDFEEASLIIEQNLSK
ncbi:MAG TPA: tRNA (adenosine(37)-N6)-dimethylallyltransferase MiaA [Ignavibacteriales bacterium]|nr:tRNA (adenosine(37)-N6)-dimethylallyltransferase MiaA [Ignavibacteriales bacterium]